MPHKTNQHNPDLTPVSRTLRKNMTTQEKRLWYQFLRNLSIPVHRQKIFGNYIVDFYCHEAQMVIELDGSQHYELQHQARDNQRDMYLSGIGCEILRYSNADVNHRFRDVCEDILNHIDSTVSP